MQDLPSLDDAQLDALADRVQDQLAHLQAMPDPDASARGWGKGRLPPAPAQQAEIEKLTGEPFETFWQKYRRLLRKDLCVPGGMLHGQWQKWRDLETKPAVKVSYAWLAAMGIPTASLAPLAVATTVFLLNVLLKVGIEAICEGATDEEKDKGAAEDKKDEAGPAGEAG